MPGVSSRGAKNRSGLSSVRTSKRTHWSSTAARRVLALAGNEGSVDAAVISIARRALVGIGCPPTDLNVLMDRLGVKDCSLESGLPVSGELRRTATGYQILYAPNLSIARRRFTIAHELAHVLLDDGQGTAAHAGRELERLCDMIATELILPRDEFLARAGVRPGLAAVTRLADLFKTSLTATAIRCGELTGASVMEVMNGSVIWAYGQVRRMREELINVVNAAVAGTEVLSDVSFIDAGVEHEWHVEGRSLGRDRNRALILLRPIASIGAR